MDRLQKLLPPQHRIMIKDQTEKVCDSSKNNLTYPKQPFYSKIGLLEMMEPLITHIIRLRLMHEPSLSYKELAKEYITSFVEGAPVSVAFLDLDLKFITYSPKWISWLKYNSIAKLDTSHLKGKSILELLNPCPKLIKKILNNNLKGISESRALLQYKIKNRNRAIRWESFPWRDQEQSIMGVIVFCEDITKRQELALRNKRLEQSNQMLENFALILSHDLIQPIRQISNFIGLLYNDLKKINGEPLAEHGLALRNILSNEPNMNPQIEYIFSAINKSLSQIHALSEGIILYCRNGDLTVNSESISLLQVIQEVRNSCLMANQTNIKVLLTEDVYLQANKICMLQLFQNLLINAVKYSSKDNPLITINGHKLDNNYYQVTIHNSGACSSNYIKQNIFEPFCSSNTDGSGLGLMICKKIVTAYKGSIQIKSSVKYGTTVSIILPIVN